MSACRPDEASINSSQSKTTQEFRSVQDRFFALKQREAESAFRIDTAGRQDIKEIPCLSVTRSLTLLCFLLETQARVTSFHKQSASDELNQFSAASQGLCIDSQFHQPAESDWRFSWPRLVRLREPGALPKRPHGNKCSRCVSCDYLAAGGEHG